jgi:hypothetical protein
MTFRSLFRITLISGSLVACMNQYTSPGGEVENTSTEPTSSEPSDSSEATSDSSDSTSSSSQSSGTANEGQRAPSEASGTCDDQTCVSTTDCCKGYQCGFDPERSKVMRYCLAQ